MTTVKTFISVILLTLVTTVTYGQNAEKILVKAFNLKGNNAVLLDLEGTTETEMWNENYLRIQMTVNIENGSDAMLKSLIKAGRYNLKGTETTAGYEIEMPNLERTVTVGGKELVEKYSFTVFTPSNVSVKNLNEASASVAVPTSEFE